MSKELKALYKIANAEMKEQYKATKNGFVYRVISDEYSKELKTIEKALKRLEELEKAFDSLSKEDEKAKKFLSLEIEKNRALNEILALHDKWLGNEMSDFEFFTLLAEIKDKYCLSKEVLL